MYLFQYQSYPLKMNKPHIKSLKFNSATPSHSIPHSLLIKTPRKKSTKKTLSPQPTHPKPIVEGFNHRTSQPHRHLHPKLPLPSRYTPSPNPDTQYNSPLAITHGPIHPRAARWPFRLGSRQQRVQIRRLASCWSFSLSLSLSSSNPHRIERVQCYTRVPARAAKRRMTLDSACSILQVSRSRVCRSGRASFRARIIPKALTM